MSQKKYIVVYSYLDKNNEGGHGEINITVDHPIETQEDLKEVARSIGQSHHGYVQVAINKVTEVDDHFEFRKVDQ